jgi:hypothetical protein
VLATLWVVDPRRERGALVGGYERLIGRALEPRTLQIAMTEHVPRLLEPVMVDAAFATRLVWPWVDRVMAVVLIVLGCALARRRPLWGLLFIMTLLMIVLVPEPEPVYKPQARYLLAVLPLLAYAWWLAAAWIGRRVGGWIGPAAFLVVLGLWVVPNVARVGWVLIEQRRVPFLDHYEDGEFREMPALADAIRRHVDADTPVLVRSRRAHILSFLSDRDVREGTSMQRLFPPPRRVAVIFPEPPDEQAIHDYLDQQGLVIGPPLASVARQRGHSWTLHVATREPPASAPAPADVFGRPPASSAAPGPSAASHP